MGCSHIFSGSIVTQIGVIDDAVELDSTGSFDLTHHFQSFFGSYGQWSVEIMQNGKDFYIIDMAIAENSAFYDNVPKSLRNPKEENWLPKIDMKG